MIRKGDIYYIRHYNSNPRKSGRPAVVLSGDKMNQDSDAVIVAFMSSRPDAILDPFSICIKSMGRRSYAITNKLSAVTKDRLTRCVGHVTPKELTHLDAALCQVLEL